jgi:hypothetical protein
MGCGAMSSIHMSQEGPLVGCCVDSAEPSGAWLVERLLASQSGILCEELTYPHGDRQPCVWACVFAVNGDLAVWTLLSIIWPFTTVERRPVVGWTTRDLSFYFHLCVEVSFAVIWPWLHVWWTSIADIGALLFCRNVHCVRILELKVAGAKATGARSWGLPSFSSDVNNEWPYTPTVLYTFMTWLLTTFMTSF